jgi:hypothetical protein
VERFSEAEGSVLVLVVPFFELSEAFGLHALRDVVLRGREAKEFDISVALSIE